MKAIVAILLVFAVSACGGGELPETAQDVCYESGMATCQRVMECNSSVNFDECVNVFMGGCCMDAGKCGQMVTNQPTVEEWDACLDALRNNSCSNIVNGILPAACLGL